MPSRITQRGKILNLLISARGQEPVNPGSFPEFGNLVKET